MIAKPFLPAGLRYLMLLFLFSSTGCIVYSGHLPLSGIDSAGLATAMQRSAVYLSLACGQDGKFMYRINPLQTVQPPEKYNIVRHAGALYALSCYAALTQDQACIQACSRAAAYLKANTLAALPSRDDLLAVWSYPLIEHTAAPVQAKLGGTGLALTALLNLENILPGTTPVHELRHMGEFIIFMQKEDGSFYSKYIPSAGGRSDLWSSLYYPGEAALGLMMLYEKDRDTRWLQAAADALARLAKLRAGQTIVPADHWALLATAHLLPYYPHCRQQVTADSLLRHAAQICESILSTRPPFTPMSRCRGALVEDGSTCATATRLEGLLAALAFLPQDFSDLRGRVCSAVNEGMAFLMRSQIASGPHAGGMPRNICCTIQGGEDARGHTCSARAAEIRVDYVQHALSAMMMYQRLAGDMLFSAKHGPFPDKQW